MNHIMIASVGFWMTFLDLRRCWVPISPWKPCHRQAQKSGLLGNDRCVGRKTNIEKFIQISKWSLQVHLQNQSSLFKNEKTNAGDGWSGEFLGAAARYAAQRQAATSAEGATMPGWGAKYMQAGLGILWFGTVLNGFLLLLVLLVLVQIEDV